MRSSSTNQYDKASGAAERNPYTNKQRGNSKPLIAPKPLLLNYQNCSLDDSPSTITNVLLNGSCSSSQKYASYPSAVLIRDENISETRNNVELSSLPLLVQVSSNHKYSVGSSNSYKDGLPYINKSDIRDKQIELQTGPQIRENFSLPKVTGRTLRGTAKNALLMEKIRGNMKLPDGYIHNSTQPNSQLELSLLSKSDSPTENDVFDKKKNCLVTVNNCLNVCLNSSDNSQTVIDDSIQNLQMKENKSSPMELIDNGIAINSIPVSSLSLISLPCNSDTREVFSSYQALPTMPEDMKPGNLSYINRSDNINGITPQVRELITFVENKDDSFMEDKTVSDEVDSVCPLTNKFSIPTPSFHIAASQSAPCSPATKPSLQKAEAVDMEEYDYYKRLNRGISRATENINIVSRARSEIAKGMWETFESGCIGLANNTPFFLETPVFTFTLPDLTVYSDEFRTFLEKDLIEMSTLISLEAAGRLNWWAMIGASQRLWPLATSGDGNCLLHAASLGMWGFHDRLLTLRKALHDFLTKSQFCQALWRRWRFHVAMQNKETGLMYSPSEWEAEWENVLRLASSAPRATAAPLETVSNAASNLSQNADSISQGKLNSSSPLVYESLEEIHVLALAHVLRRPIIVVADTTLKDINGDPLAPIPFGGIYLPLECPHRQCKRSPLLLTYDAAHFSALVIMEKNEKEEDSTKPSLPAVIPVTDCSHKLLPILFLIDPGEEFVWGRDELNERIIQKLTMTEDDRKGLLNEYLDLTQVAIPPNYLDAATSYCGQEEDSSESIVGDQKSSESSFDSDDSPPFFDGTGVLSSKMKASRQLQTVVKSFGSIGRSMSQRIKRNLSKLSRTGSFRKKNNFNKGFRKGSKKVRIATNQHYILAAQIHTDKRHAYQEEMIENYLAAAKERFMHEAPPKPQAMDKIDGVPHKIFGPESMSAVKCINSGCNLYGTAQTAYMCSSCFCRQKEHEKEYQRQLTSDAKKSPSDEPWVGENQFEESLTLRSKGCGTQYGTGKSKFYMTLDEEAMKNASLIPTTQSLSGVKDKTLFLSNSTFFNDTIPSYNLNNDLKREVGNRGDSTKITKSTNLRDSLLINHFNQGNSSLMPSTRGDSLAPVCIDEARMRSNCPQKSSFKCLDQPADQRSQDEFLPRNCLTDGCPFFGNVTTDFLCSKCHSSKKKSNQGGADSFTLEQIKFVQI